MRQIIAMGGGGFSMEPENPLLDQYVLQQAKAEVPKICFVPTASGDAEGYIQRFYNFFDKKRCMPTHLSLFQPLTRDLHGYLLDQDIIYVGGGSTKNMLALWKEWDVDLILKEAWERGIVLAGVSAGAICWFEQGLTDSYGDKVEPIPCLGFIKGSCTPHYDGEENRRPAYKNYIHDQNMLSGYALDDGAALHYVGKEVHDVISSRPQAKAYHVYKALDKTIEEKLPIKYLKA
ncbi:peptidase E [Halobacillus shinanisalinarum]|uniref:Peptidase E n=1 Tax=Halobacillus shinanisalinarum TaxID=2932258 RepID=A0ABY4H5G0_9BACI|nr:peptidase E [Halobacillus shinanisalinarum]UOQ95695.1 peptidase E [Halobacillus shinanisalinarum]